MDLLVSSALRKCFIPKYLESLERKETETSRNEKRENEIDCLTCSMPWESPENSYMHFHVIHDQVKEFYDMAMSLEGEETCNIWDRLCRLNEYDNFKNKYFPKNNTIEYLYKEKEQFIIETALLRAGLRKMFDILEAKCLVVDDLKSSNERLKKKFEDALTNQKSVTEESPDNYVNEIDNGNSKRSYLSEKEARDKVWQMDCIVSKANEVEHEIVSLLEEFTTEVCPILDGLETKMKGLSEIKNNSEEEMILLESYCDKITGFDIRNRKLNLIISGLKRQLEDETAQKTQGRLEDNNLGDSYKKSNSQDAEHHTSSEREMHKETSSSKECEHTTIKSETETMSPDHKGVNKNNLESLKTRSDELISMKEELKSSFLKNRTNNVIPSYKFSKNSAEEYIKNSEDNEEIIKDLVEECSDFNTKIEEVLKEKMECETRICSLQRSFETETETLRKQLNYAEVARDSFLSSKMMLSEKVEILEAEKDKYKGEIESLSNQFHILKDRFAVEMEEHKLESSKKCCLYEKQVVELNISLEDRIHELDDLKKSYEDSKNTITILEKKAEVYEKKINEAISQKLELEAQVGASSDERRALLERCLGAETELDRSRSNVIELRRKLDDSQAALHELGRENQAIQLDLNKLTGRKWADNSDVNECAGCKNAFSLTVRKHHCRNCGQIFCKECSSKTSSYMSNFKKPQRVCDCCFEELATK